MKLTKNKLKDESLKAHYAAWRNQIEAQKWDEMNEEEMRDSWQDYLKEFNKTQPILPDESLPESKLPPYGIGIKQLKYVDKNARGVRDAHEAKFIERKRNFGRGLDIKKSPTSKSHANINANIEITQSAENGQVNTQQNQNNERVERRQTQTQTQTQTRTQKQGNGFTKKLGFGLLGGGIVGGTLTGTTIFLTLLS